MRLALQVNYTDDVRQAADLVVALERVGLDMVWLPEAYAFDAPTGLGYLAAKTERVELGFGILPIYTRTPALIAQTAAGLDAVSDGRAVLGLGTSGPQVIEGWHGVPFDLPLERTREVVEICRRAWRRETLVHDGPAYRLPLPPERGTGLGKPLKLMLHPRRPRIPIYVAALGPKNVELAAEVADGWLPLFFWPEKAAETWGPALRRGLAKRAPDLGPLEVAAAGGYVAIGEGLEHLRDLARPGLALYVGGMGARGRNFYNDLVCRYGFEAEAATVQDFYLSGQKSAAEAALPAALVEGTTLIGPPSFVRERVAAYKAAGVTILTVVPVGPDPVATIAQLKEIVA